MIIIDTNIILRYLLKDSEKLSEKAIEIIDNNKIYIPTEVIVEASYVLKKIYNVQKEMIYKAVKLLIDIEDIEFQNKETIESAFKLYAKRSFDIVDCLLFAYNKIGHYEVKTFDEKLYKLIKQ